MNKKILIRLYTLEGNLSSERVLLQIKKIISNNDNKGWKLEIIDIKKNPRIIEEDGVLAVPTLIRKNPLPEKKIIGSFEDINQLISILTH